MHTAMIWLSRATGIGYRPYPPIVGGIVPSDYADQLVVKSDEIERQIEMLERELRRRGHLPRH